MYGDCERARQWASADVDAELSTFEGILLTDHLAGCPSCREFRRSVGGLTSALRLAPSERFEGIVISPIRRRVHLRLAPAVAAMAVAAVGLGGILLASSELRQGSIGPVQPARATSVDAGLDTMDLRTMAALQRVRAAKPVRPAPQPSRSLRGGRLMLDS